MWIRETAFAGVPSRSFQRMKRIHFIAIGGSAMHNLAIALHRKGLNVSGSDDEIYEPSKGRLLRQYLLPASMGWYPDRITKELELAKAQELGIPIYSYPEFIYEQTKDKTRVVIGGSHGKTTITSMIIHVLRHAGKDLDYLVGAQLDGFDCMVRLTAEAPIAIIEGDEYLSSPIDRRPKFHLYHPNIAVLSGIAWDHINVFPTFENYVEQFEAFIGLIERGGTLVYSFDDVEVKRLAENAPDHLSPVSYTTPAHTIRDGVTYLDEGDVQLSVFGKHNLQNMEAARGVCKALSVSDGTFNEAIKSFAGASKRLELLQHENGKRVFKDFAHSPSKLKASIGAVREQFAGQKLIAAMELHTFSSLNAEFIAQYKNTMNDCDAAILFYDEHAVAMKRAQLLSHEELRAAFGRLDLQIVGSAPDLIGQIRKANDSDAGVLLLMTSGTMGGADIKDIAEAFVA